MIGNDVVDLADEDARPGTRHRRFDARVFGETEHALLATSPDADRLRWVLWAAKESAYKVARKEAPRTVFSPSRFVVALDGRGSARVHAGDRRFRVELVVERDHVHAVARPADRAPASVCSAVAPLGAGAASPSAAARRLAVAVLASALAVPPDDLAIRRDGRIPTLWVGGARCPADLSLSHHGRFVAFACALPLGRSW